MRNSKIFGISFEISRVIAAINTRLSSKELFIISAPYHFVPLHFVPLHFVPFTSSHAHFVPFTTSQFISSQVHFVPQSLRPIHFVPLHFVPNAFCPKLILSPNISSHTLCSSNYCWIITHFIHIAICYNLFHLLY